ncbi:AMP-binding protein [Massilia forsythiae]|uniref:AMP-binding protein n=1 Tax=Massilia forsythiae TaxID=2728020 RepID=A0A7Z2ZTL1_9BURK|nr:AMP-binding protein [Massilia forsythiae]QJE01633.1 AMP-binding protein [Massilia forsythiae]
MTPTERFIRARDFLQQHRSDYDTAYRDYRAPELAEFNWALDYFDVHARGNDTAALWVVEEDGSDRRISYADMAARSGRVAAWLRDCGVRRGDRVLLMLPNRVELWETMLAGIKLGAVLVPTTMLVSGADLEDRMARGRIRHVVAQASEAPKFAALAGEYTRIAVGAQDAPPPAGWRDYADSLRTAADFQPDGITLASDPLLLYFTSGTTAKPKLVLHSHQSYPVGHLSTMYWIGLRAGDVHWNISSPGWAKHAWSCVFAPWNAGATVFVHNYERFSARACLDTIVRCGVTSLCAPPTVWRMLIKEDLAAWQPPLRELVGAGEPLNPEVIDQVERAWGIRIRDGFGQSETTCQVGNSPGQPVKPGSMGRPLPGYRVALLDLDDRPAAEGEIALALDPAPLGLMLGYEGDAAKTGEVMRAGHYHTGDSATVDEEGYYFYVGRNDDVFKSSDYRISPFELESVLIEHPDVLEAAIVPSPDPLRLAVPKAYVALRAGVAPTRELAGAIFAFARTRLSPYQRIRRLEFTELPKTISGKIRRVELRRAEAAGQRTGVEFREEEFAE